MASHLGEHNSEVIEIRWDLARTWFQQGKVDESKKLALEMIALVRRYRSDQHQQYVRIADETRKIWCVNPDGTAVSDVGTGNGESRVALKGRCREIDSDGMRHGLRTP